MATASVPWEFDAMEKTASASEKIAPPWTSPCAVPVMVADLHTCFSGAFGVLQDLDAEVPCKLVLLYELLHRVHGLYFLLADQVPPL